MRPAAAAMQSSHTKLSNKTNRVKNNQLQRAQCTFTDLSNKSSLKKTSKSQTARERACAEQNAYRPAWQLVRAVACAILYALGVTCARAMSPRVKQKCQFCLKNHSKSQTARERACVEQNAYRPAWQLVRTVACAILHALDVTCARAMSPRVKHN